MKIQCDVCDKGEATIFCAADEAALCDDCDRRVHHANKLANKHTRYSLLHPPFKESPLCDICQERRALLFCQEDRAILCRECDVPIHRSNEHTQKHNRFLLTGVKLSSSSPPNQASSSSSALSTDMKISRSSAKRQNCPPSSVSTAERSLPLGAYQDENHTSDAGSISTSSISEYLMETLPGWHVDEFLDPSSTASNGYCKTFDHMLPVVDPDLVTDTSSSASKDFANYSPKFLINSLIYLSTSLRLKVLFFMAWISKRRQGATDSSRNRVMMVFFMEAHISIPSLIILRLFGNSFESTTLLQFVDVLSAMFYFIFFPSLY
ncbi:B-box zinc finger protein 20 isoform X1 [Eucalyptus grandis]|uniref:B-box zinc finger protein 20 isoform X1 n=1 Tax=Eucalyptus grandis TaxID=71139 RepID=UPI00192EDF64|nr:B-box zinc finger protein 20 isoform X1 [Eucalyptus grandis]